MNIGQTLDGIEQQSNRLGANMTSTATLTFTRIHLFAAIIRRVANSHRFLRAKYMFPTILAFVVFGFIKGGISGNIDVVGITFGIALIGVMLSTAVVWLNEMSSDWKREQIPRMWAITFGLMATVPINSFVFAPSLMEGAIMIDGKRMDDHGVRLAFPFINDVKIVSDDQSVSVGGKYTTLDGRMIYLNVQAILARTEPPLYYDDSKVSLLATARLEKAISHVAAAHTEESLKEKLAESEYQVYKATDLNETGAKWNGSLRISFQR